MKKRMIPSGVDSFFYDFDGVMTDNKVFVSSDGVESVVCHRGDGWAIGRLKKTGMRQCIISTEKNPVVRVRARKLGIPVIQGVANKGTALVGYARKNRIDLKKSAFVGNDDNDLPAMKLVSFCVAPADATLRVKKMADLITDAKGGQGVIREMIEYMKHQ
jgi:YrbI family 3-deoxy-D-manno-octulosonate 8-phosphate phosphatase